MTSRNKTTIHPKDCQNLKSPDIAAKNPRVLGAAEPPLPPRNFVKTPQDLLFSRQDKMDPRLGEKVRLFDNEKEDLDQTLQENSKNYILLGYEDDEGIRLNGGRPGAALAPQQIRRYLYRMTPPDASSMGFLDLGNLNPKDLSLGERHEIGKSIVHTICKNQRRWISLGGGHDYGFADSAGFLTHFGGMGHKKPLIINFDAHLDVRPTEKGFHSGTPFYRLLNEYPDQFHFFEIGIQNQCNSPFHLTWCKDRGASVWTLDEVIMEGLLEKIKKSLLLMKDHPCFISIDIDGFSNQFAPGCSQSWARGLQVEEVLSALKWLCRHLQVQGLGIYEVSPPLDFDDHTSKLAALIIHHFVCVNP